MLAAENNRLSNVGRQVPIQFALLAIQLYYSFHPETDSTGESSLQFVTSNAGSELTKWNCSLFQNLLQIAIGILVFIHYFNTKILNIVDIYNNLFKNINFWIYVAYYLFQTVSISMLLRYSHHQIFVFIGEYCS